MNQRRLFIKRIAIGSAILPCFNDSRADRVGYESVFSCSAESSQLRAEHHHDWSQSTREARWQMISNGESVFSSKNTYSSLTVIDRNSGGKMFQAAVPAISYLWISEDTSFIVGVSKIKLWNPIQVVVFSARGRLLLAQQVKASTFSGVSESVSNWVFWYKEPFPQIAISLTQDIYTISIEGNTGEQRVFNFKEPA